MPSAVQQKVCDERLRQFGVEPMDVTRIRRKNGVLRAMIEAALEGDRRQHKGVVPDLPADRFRQSHVFAARRPPHWGRYSRLGGQLLTDVEILVAQVLVDVVHFQKVVVHALESHEEVTEGSVAW